MKPDLRKTLVLLLVLGVPSTAVAAEITVAVASNFSTALAELASAFTAATGHEVRISAASTGKHYAQIVNGAPFDLFLAADAERPRLLEAAGLGVAGSRFPYAVGGLVLWSRDPQLADRDCREALAPSHVGRIAIANPVTAPYGAAAREYLEAEGRWADVRPRLVIGENIAQTLQFAVAGGASAGFIARSQALDARLPAPTCAWPVPAGAHAPIEQQALLLSRASDRPEARAFLDFLRGPEAAAIIERRGYHRPALGPAGE